MKTSQLVLALAAMMVMVFAITFAMNYLGTTPSAKDPIEAAGADLPMLEFETTFFPAVKYASQQWEQKKPGYADFWFVNSTSAPIRVGLKSKSCTCTNAELFLATPELQQRRAVNGQVAQLWPLGGLGVPAYLTREKNRMDDPGQAATRFPLTPQDEGGQPVGPGMRGWVRLNWTGDRESVQVLRAELWHHDKNGPTQAVEARLNLVRPAYMPQSVESLGKLSPQDLPKKTSILCVSPTREDLVIKAAPYTLSKSAAAELVKVGAPVKLSVSEIEALTQIKPGAAMSVYRIPIELQAREGDRLFDSGPFRKLVQITVENTHMEPILFPITGTIESEVRVGGREDNGRVFIGPFARSQGSPRRGINLSSDVDDLRLELDHERVPDFLNVKFKDHGVQPGGHRLWVLEVWVPPFKANGVFPRDDNKNYLDSAVYLKTVGKGGGRYLRIPVEGNADNR